MKSGRYQLLAHRESPDAILVLSADFQILYWNAGAQAIFGYSDADAVGVSIFDLLVPPERVNAKRRLLAKTLSHGLHRFESLLRRNDGTLVYADVSGKVVREAAHGPALVLLTAKDITHLRVIRDSKLVEAKFSDMLESIPDGIVMVNATGHIVFANKHAGRLFGYRADELSGKAVESLLPHRLRNAHLAHRSEYFAQPRPRAVGAGLELFGVRKDGTEFPVEISLSPLETEEGMLVSSAIRDITDRKRFEEALHEKNIQLADASRAKDRFLASISHELRTPLNAIIGFTGTLLMKLPGPLNPDQTSQLTTVQRSARHLLSLINDLLDVAKIEADKIEVKRELVDCRGVLEELGATLRPLAKKKGLELIVEDSGPAVILNTDQRVFSQILINLIDNGIKFTERGAVTVSITRIPANCPTSVCIAVQDTGPGITAAGQLKLFEPFSRVEAEGGPRSAGTGLGLHLSRKLAGLLGGTLTCQSAEGHGATFTLRLSLA